MSNYRQNLEAKERLAERRRREDQAPRLKLEVPTLESLHFEVDEMRGGEIIGGSAHTRRIVVESAPALFVIACSDRTCREGGFDLTAEIMRSLRSGATHFDGELACQGDLSYVRCGRVLRYRATAKYRA
jgi:hypothetical protein